MITPLSPRAKASPSRGYIFPNQFPSENFPTCFLPPNVDLDMSYFDVEMSFPLFARPTNVFRFVCKRGTIPHGRTSSNVCSPVIHNTTTSAADIPPSPLPVRKKSSKVEFEFLFTRHPASSPHSFAPSFAFQKQERSLVSLWCRWGLNPENSFWEGVKVTREKSRNRLRRIDQKASSLKWGI